MSSRSRTLLSFVKDSEDAADGLYAFRARLPRYQVRITNIISQLFSLSSGLQLIYDAHHDPYLSAAFHRIDPDLRAVLNTLKITLEAVFSMLGRSRSLPHQGLWEDLNHRMEVDEGMGLLPRLERYQSYLKDLDGVLRGRLAHASIDQQAVLLQLTRVQQDALNQAQRRIDLGGSTPRQRSRSRPPSRPHSRHQRTRNVQTTMWSSTDGSGSINSPTSRPFAPEPPMTPLSPTYTSGSSETFNSSQPSSYFSDAYSSGRSVHWATNVFNGSNPTSEYELRSPKDYPSVCKGTPDSQAITKLARDGFMKVVELQFDAGELMLWLYWRPNDQRARMLIMTYEDDAESFFCQPLTNLKVVRSGSSLQFCRFRLESDHMILWARLNFVFHERMVLFYSTFIAMKRQDGRTLAPALLDHLALDHDNDGFDDHEEILFAGEIKHGEWKHTVYLLQDRPSRTVRLEASASRGPFKHVPIWTAFVTKYAKINETAWAEGDPRSTHVTLAALKPKPAVFNHGGAEPTKNKDGLYVLPFTSRTDASHFTEQWNALCKNFHRR